MANNQQKEINSKRMVYTLIALAITAVALNGCNTVRGVAQDVTDAANALDPDE